MADKQLENERQDLPPAAPSTAASDNAAAASAAATVDDDALAARMGLNDKPEYRSMGKVLSAAGPPSLSLMHGGGGAHAAARGFASGLPGAPMTFTGAKSKSPGGAAGSFSIGVKKADAAPSFGVRTDRTKYVGVAPRELPPPPFRLELHTHFHAKLEAIQRVCSVVGRKLCDLDTDFEFKADKCKWKVEFRRNSGAQRVNLNILIFKTGKEYVVEVQRREGDITALMFLYNELKTFFKLNQLLADKATAGARTKRPAPKALPKTALSSADVRDGVSALKGLLASKFVDTQLQGVLGAISLSAQEEASRPEMAALIPELVALGQSTNANVARLVGVALSRLCDHPECRQAFVASQGWQFIVDCAAGVGPGMNPEVQRESLHVVESLCPLYHDELAKAESASKVLALVQGWQSIEDPRLKKHAYNAHCALKDAGVIA